VSRDLSNCTSQAWRWSVSLTLSLHYTTRYYTTLHDHPQHSQQHRVRSREQGGGRQKQVSGPLSEVKLPPTLTHHSLTHSLAHNNNTRKNSHFCFDDGTAIINTTASTQQQAKYALQQATLQYDSIISTTHNLNIWSLHTTFLVAPRISPKRIRLNRWAVQCSNGFREKLSAGPTVTLRNCCLCAHSTRLPEGLVCKGHRIKILLQFVHWCAKY
jgi:hypothetical protein